MTHARLAALLAVLFAAAAGRAQTMLDQEERLIEIHSLLLAMEPGGPPGAYDWGQASLGVEMITIPPIDGTTGGKRQITASDRTPIYPRLRFALGLPAPEGFRASVGLAYIPPIELREVSSHLGALSGELAWTPGPFALGLRANVLVARSTSPVTDPATRDTLHDVEYGADVSAGYSFPLGVGTLTPYAGAGVTRVIGNFQVTSDGYVLHSRTVNPSLDAGVRLLAARSFEAAAELVAWPGRLVHPGFRIAWVPRW
jgi:hypothetical protein